MGSCIIVKARGENDTATSTNILPNAGTTSSNMDNHNLDGVNSGTGNLNHNSTHNGFTITCGTQISGACGRAFNGELESSRDMKVAADGTLVDVTGVEGGVTYIATQNKLDGVLLDLINSKQSSLLFDNNPTLNSPNILSSGVIYNNFCLFVCKLLNILCTDLVTLGS